MSQPLSFILILWDPSFFPPCYFHFLLSNHEVWGSLHFPIWLYTADSVTRRHAVQDVHAATIAAFDPCNQRHSADENAGKSRGCGVILDCGEENKPPLPRLSRRACACTRAGECFFLICVSACTTGVNVKKRERERELLGWRARESCFFILIFL